MLGEIFYNRAAMSQAAEQPVRRLQLTAEGVAWTAVLTCALLLRWANLASALDEGESAQALRALAALRAPDAVLNGAFSVLQAASLATFGASEGAARLPAVVLGTLLVGTPLLLRSMLGRAEALTLGALFVLSPTLTFAARSAEGAVGAWGLAWLAFALAVSNRAVSAAVALGVTLAAGPEGVPAALIAIAAAVATGFRASAARLLPTAVSGFVLAASAGLSRWVGLGESLAALASGLSPAALFSSERLLMGFAISEPMAWIGALASGVWLLVQRASLPLARGWVAWLVGGGLLVLVRPVPWSVLPLALGAAGLASVGYTRLLALLLDEAPRSLGITGLAALALAYAALALRQFAESQLLAWGAAPLVSIAMLLLIFSLGSLGFSPASLLRSVAAAGLIFLALHTLSANFHLNLVRPNNSAEPYRALTPAEGLGALMRTVQALSTRATGEPYALRVHYPDDAPAVLRWAMRHWRFAEAHEAQVWLMPSEAQPNVNRALLGHGFLVTQRASLRALVCAAPAQCFALARWTAFREAPAVQAERWTLWVDADLALRASGYR